MTRAALIRLLLAGALAMATGAQDARAQQPPQPPQPPTRPLLPVEPAPQIPGRSHSDVKWFIIGGAAAAILGWVIGNKVLSGPGPATGPLPPTLPPSLPPVTQLEVSPLPQR